jgi:hypothetical protein
VSAICRRPTWRHRDVHGAFERLLGHRTPASPHSSLGRCRRIEAAIAVLETPNRWVASALGKDRALGRAVIASSRDAAVRLGDEVFGLDPVAQLLGEARSAPRVRSSLLPKIGDYASSPGAAVTRYDDRADCLEAFGAMPFAAMT